MAEIAAKRAHRLGSDPDDAANAARLAVWQRAAREELNRGAVITTARSAASALARVERRAGFTRLPACITGREQGPGKTGPGTTTRRWLRIEPLKADGLASSGTTEDSLLARQQVELVLKAVSERRPDLATVAAEWLEWAWTGGTPSMVEIATRWHTSRTSAFHRIAEVKAIARETLRPAAVSGG